MAAVRAVDHWVRSSGDGEGPSWQQKSPRENEVQRGGWLKGRSNDESNPEECNQETAATKRDRVVREHAAGANDGEQRG